MRRNEIITKSFKCKNVCLEVNEISCDHMESICHLNESPANLKCAESSHSVLYESFQSQRKSRFRMPKTYTNIFHFIIYLRSLLAMKKRGAKKPKTSLFA